MSEVASLEAQRKHDTEAIDRRDMAMRLSRNRDFKRLILDYFCTEECARYVHASANPALSESARADALALAQAAGHLRRFLAVVKAMGDQAEGNREQLDYELTVARQEEEAYEDDGVETEMPV